MRTLFLPAIAAAALIAADAGRASAQIVLTTGSNGPPVFYRNPATPGVIYTQSFATPTGFGLPGTYGWSAPGTYGWGTNVPITPTVGMYRPTYGTGYQSYYRGPWRRW
ncbi:MAG TPA: hypothetical protein VH092_29355 [Urbifossiella sp.]|jgi:hypothetical protein|nr:hypothetical protein [Urbifossiella sp.]